MENSNSHPNEIDEELVAYLDGELPLDKSQQVEQRLSVDADYRKRLRDLERTWDMLDDLPANDPPTAFTKSTLEMVVTQAARIQADKRHHTFTWPIRVLVLAGLPLLLCGTAFALTRSLQNGPYQKLLRDLPVIENLDLYSRIDDLHFLELLHQEGIFLNAPEVGEANYE